MRFIDISNNSGKKLFLSYKKNKKISNLIFFLILFIGIIYSIVAPFQYVSESSIMPPKQSGGGMNISSIIQSMGMGGLSSMTGMPSTNLSLVYNEVILSSSVANYIIDSCQLEKTKLFKGIPRHLLIMIIKSDLKVLIDKSGVLYITTTVRTRSFPSKSDKQEAAQLSAKIGNAAILGLDFVIRQRNSSVSGKTKDFIGKEIDSYSAKLDSIQNELEKFRKDNKVLELEEQTKAIVLQANTIAVELAKAEVELSIGKKIYAENSQNYKMLKESYDILRSQYDKIQSGGLTSKDEFSIPLNEVPGLLRTYSNLVRDQKLYEQILIYMKTNFYQEAIQEKRDIPQIDVLDWAVVPFEKDAPSYKMLFIFLFVIDFGVLFLYLIFKANRDENILTQIEQNHNK